MGNYSGNDIYIANLAELKNGKPGPKEKVAEDLRDRLEREGIYVPAIVMGPEEIKDKKDKRLFVVRGSCWEEYTGFSGLSTSIICRYSGLEEAIAKVTRKNSAIRDYEKLTGSHIQMHFSIWEYIPGINLAVIADSAIKGKYHIFLSESSLNSNKSDSGKNDAWLIDARGDEYIVYDINKKKKIKIAGKRNIATKEIIEKAIRAYEIIRNMSEFDKQHCPIIELQMDSKGNIYFLQYHRTRDFKGSSFRIDEKYAEQLKKDGFKEAAFVRGFTDKTIVRVSFIYSGTINGWNEEELNKLKKLVEDGSFDLSVPAQVTEALARERIVSCKHCSSERELLGGHSIRTRMFKSELFIAGHFFTNEEFMQELNKARKKPDSKAVLSELHIEVISDGERGFFRKVLL